MNGERTHEGGVSNNRLSFEGDDWLLDSYVPSALGSRKAITVEIARL